MFYSKKESKQKMKKKIVAILPAYNQERQIAQLIKEVGKYVSEIIIVSDGSTDRTAELSAKSGAIVPEPILERGKGNAVRRGLEISKALSPEVIVLMDADGQNNPKEIPQIVSPILSNDYDMVIGSRFLGVMKTSNLHKFGNYILNTLHFFLTFKWVTDTESGFRAFKAEKLYSLKPNATHYEIESDILLEAIKNKLRIKEVPIKILKKEKGILALDGFKIFSFIIKKRLKDILKL